MRTFLAALALLSVAAPSVAGQARVPNIVYILADDLGYGELGCYGQTKIRTPNLDRLAAEGVRFTQHYSGSPVCAPSRCVLMTGLHTGHAYVRGNKEMGGWGPDEPEGQLPLPDEAVTVAELLQARGYATCAVGKWGLGGPGSSGHPNNQGFDLFYGLLCQRVAHNYYPTHLWRNSDVDVLDGNRWFSAHQKLSQAPEDRDDYLAYAGARYAPDEMLEEALGFVRKHAREPFFLYYATPVPHAALQVPEDSLADYAGRLDDGPYLGQQGYLPHPEPRAAYAAMVTRMDRDVGRLLALLRDLGLEDDTLVMFSSDNGPTFNGGTDSEFFESNGPLSGLKCSLYEGGVRVPMIARWPGKIRAGTTTDHVSAFEDVLPTLVEVAGGEVPAGLDGLSFLPTLLGEDDQEERAYLYWEYPEVDGQQAVRMGRWKAVRRNLKQGQLAVALYDLDSDVAEEHDVAAEQPEVVARIEAIMRAARTPSEHFPIPVLDGE
ncbi:MAG: N-acetylgalactosamine-6-sulfatase [Planctomycetota bacterium]|nr:MAG: N-acetylgalactosamine-6-sulfatase [Planctomycetota bacterium]